MDARVDLGRPGINTMISYRYTDASNCKMHGEVVLEGVISMAQIEAMSNALMAGEFFLPGQVGIPDLQATSSEGHGWDEFDHPWHSIDAMETTVAPHCGVSVDAMMAKWPRTSENWDDAGANVRIREAQNAGRRFS